MKRTSEQRVSHREERCLRRLVYGVIVMEGGVVLYKGGRMEKDKKRKQKKQEQKQKKEERR